MRTVSTMETEQWTMVEILCTLWVIYYSTCLCSADNLALLSNSLKTFQRAACDDQLMVLQCPPRTSIVVQVAQYGKSHGNGTHCPEGRNQWNTTCTWPSGLQYSLLQSVVEACHKRRVCRFHATPSPDPCSWLRNFVEVAYKCRPYEFRSKMACEDEIVQLSCGPNSRLAIYSASFGRTEYESLSCPQPLGVPEETCLAMYTTETVMRICHGRRRCTLSADSTTLGNPCSPQSKRYLKIVYTCAPRIVLQDQYDSVLSPDETSDPHYEYDDVLVNSESYSEWPNLAGRRENYTTAAPFTTLTPHSLGDKILGDKEKVLYALLGMSIALIFALGAATIYLLCQRKQFEEGTLNHVQQKISDSRQMDTKIDLINVSPSSITIVPGPNKLYSPDEDERFGKDDTDVEDLTGPDLFHRGQSPLTDTTDKSVNNAGSGAARTYCF